MRGVGVGVRIGARVLASVRIEGMVIVRVSGAPGSPTMVLVVGARLRHVRGFPGKARVRVRARFRVLLSVRVRVRKPPDSPAMVLVPSVPAADAAPVAVGLPSTSAPVEPMPCRGAPGAAENLPLYARAEPGGPGAAPPPPTLGPGATTVAIGGGAVAPKDAADASAGPGCARLPADAEPAMPPLDDVAGNLTCTETNRRLRALMACMNT